MDKDSNMHSGQKRPEFVGKTSNNFYFKFQLLKTSSR